MGPTKKPSRRSVPGKATGAGSRSGPVKKRWIYFGVAVISVGIVSTLYIPYRGKKEKIQVKEVPQTKREMLFPSSEAKTGQEFSRKPTVKIIPDAPTATQDLEAVINDGGNITCKWERNGIVVAGENTQRLLKDKFKKGDEVAVIVTADGKEARASVKIENSLPVVTSVPFSPDYIHRGVDVTVTPKGYDADEDDISFRYQWSINGNDVPMGDGPVLKGDSFKKGDAISVRVTPFDKEGAGQAYEGKPLVIPNAPPRFKSTPPVEFKGDTYLYNAAAEDFDGDAITYSLASSPKGMTIDLNSGRIVWQIAKDDAGSHKIEVVAQDSDGLRVFQRYTLNITIPKEEKR